MRNQKKKKLFQILVQKQNHVDIFVSNVRSPLRNQFAGLGEEPFTGRTGGWAGKIFLGQLL